SSDVVRRASGVRPNGSELCSIAVLREMEGRELVTSCSNSGKSPLSAACPSTTSDGKWYIISGRRSKQSCVVVYPYLGRNVKVDQLSDVRPQRAHRRRARGMPPLGTRPCR